MIRDEMLINTNTFPDFSPPRNVKDYERFSFVTGEKQEANVCLAVFEKRHTYDG